MQKYPPQETMARMRGWCDRQERCHKHVQDKLADWGYYGDSAQGIISELISNNYLNEERFARAFTSGRHRIKGWGRRLILQHLKSLRISAPCIKLGLSEIDPEEYDQNLDRWIERKMIQYQGMKPFEQNGKVAQFVIRKGYESDIVWEKIKAR
jgi:regulatory protein